MSTFDKKSKYLKFKNFILKNKSNSYKTHFIQQKTIDEVFKNKDLTNCFLKIDVEGYEINVLLGAKKKIKEIKYVLVEHQLFNQYKNDFKKVKRFLINNNFEIAQNFYFPTLHYKDVLFKKNKKTPKNNSFLALEFYFLEAERLHSHTTHTTHTTHTSTHRWHSWA